MNRKFQSCGIAFALSFLLQIGSFLNDTTCQCSTSTAAVQAVILLRKIPALSSADLLPYLTDGRVIFK